MTPNVIDGEDAGSYIKMGKLNSDDLDKIERIKLSGSIVQMLEETKKIN